MEQLRRSLAVCACALAAVVCFTAAERNVYLTGEINVEQGDGAVLTCHVEQLGNDTVLWRRHTASDAATAASSATFRKESELLIAGTSRVTSDPRFVVRGGPGSGIYELEIHDLTPLDTGMYVCAINSSPPVTAFHPLSVTSRETPAPNPAPRSGNITRDYDFRHCCRLHNVTEDCLQLCTLQGMNRGGDQAHYYRCQSDFPSIYSCMADGRDHLACCVEQGVPPHCGRLCRGNYIFRQDNPADYMSCSDVTSIINYCVALGIETLPAAPASLQVRAVSLTSLLISWEPGVGHETAPPAQWYNVNVTRYRSFDDDKMTLLPSTTTELNNIENRTYISSLNHTMIQVNGSNRSVTFSHLAPLTMYEVSVTAKTVAGSSLSSSRVRAVTWVPDTRSGSAEPPELPDVQRCCSDGGVTEPRCLQDLCDPAQVTTIDYADYVECAPWAAVTLTCMTGGTDHSDCCLARGISPFCASLCSENVEEHMLLLFGYFQCLRYMSIYASCLMQGYGVVASAPLRPRVAFTDADFTILRWDAPELLPETVLHYTVEVRRLHSAENDTYTATEGVHSPLLLDHLVADRWYEFYVTAVNRHGLGAQSSRVVFKTQATWVSRVVEMGRQQRHQLLFGQLADFTACCWAADVRLDCQHLCKVTTRAFASMNASCMPERHKILQCMTGGHDHTPCCLRAGLPAPCLPDCSGQGQQWPGQTHDSCQHHAVDLLRCLASGFDQLLPPVSGVRVTRVTGNTVTVHWQTAETAQQYQVRYGNVNGTGVVDSSLARLNQTVNVTGSGEVELSNLTSGVLYAFTVITIDEHTSSSPASVVIVNVTDGASAAAPLSSPHSLSSTEITDSAMTLTWAAPDFAPQHSTVLYRVSFRKPRSHLHYMQMVTTGELSWRLENLQPSTAYDVVVTAVTDVGASPPSETLQTWTADLVPASVQLPQVEPVEVLEGGNLTVVCAAAGMPVPTVYLYINSVQRNQSQTHLLVTSVLNVKSSWLTVTCVAENSGAQVDSMIDVIVRHIPNVETSEPEQVVSEGATATLSCSVRAKPRPLLTWRGPRNRTIRGGTRGRVTTTEEEVNQVLTYMELRIEHVQAEDFGRYSCSAESELGADTDHVSLKKRTKPPGFYERSVGVCCQRLNVSRPCEGACWEEHEVDLEAVLATPGCVREFSKLMQCAADGSDHKPCCSHRLVPDHCLHWCDGSATDSRPDCVTQYAFDIISCIEEGTELSPGPPRNIKVKMINTTDAVVSWDPPSRNPDKVVLYRLNWRRLEAGSSASLDTRRTQHAISRLEAGAQYELSVRASAEWRYHSVPASLNFTATAGPTTAESSTDETALGPGAVLGLALALVVLVLVLVMAGVWLVRQRRLKAGDQDRRLSFANPSYLREPGDQDGVQESSDLALSAIADGDRDGGASGGRLGTSGSDNWQEAALQTPTSDHLNRL